ncbi:rCG26354 [Rattus norvegicus]|uniref:RCG26354 n=1 Tax=Rattus norvegicus TaxID=10116 RepID=A6HLU9_RAT|nr:rCG26354 [Rattus norvegicus]
MNLSPSQCLQKGGSAVGLKGYMAPAPS